MNKSYPKQRLLLFLVFTNTYVKMLWNGSMLNQVFPKMITQVFHHNITYFSIMFPNLTLSKIAIKNCANNHYLTSVYSNIVWR